MKAFPLKSVNPFDDSEGMDLRDYFAAQVLKSVCEDHSPESASQVAYAYADAMMKAREK